MSVVSKKFSASLDSMLVLLLLCLVTAFSSGCGSKASLDPAKPVTLTIWHVYGNQTNSPFNDTIEKFNASEGKAQGVIVKVASVSSSNVIDKALFASAKQEPGAVPLPDLFTAYPRVIPAMHDKLLHWDKYLNKEDLAVYQPEFLAEGYQDKELLMLPVAKSTELLFVNQTYFDRFAAATGASTDDFADYDKLFALCRKYYTWTGGKNMCQLDDFYNYYLTSMASLGDPLIKDGKPDLASSNFKRIFRAAAEPAIAGGLGIEKGYAADAWKTADLISNVGFTAPLTVGASEHRVAVMLPADSYYHLQRQAKMRLLIMLGIILLLSLLSAGYFSKRYVDPLVADLQQLQQNPDAPPQSNVLELNQFFEFLQNHSEQQAEKLRQLQSENNQVQKQYGLAAMRLQEAQEKQKQTANQYIACRPAE